VRARDAVDDHRVGGGADRAGKAPVALEGRHGPARADEALGRAVELAGRDARADHALDQGERRDEDLTGTCHAVDLLRGLLDDHPRSLASRVRRLTGRYAALELLLEAERRDGRADVVVDLVGAAPAVEAAQQAGLVV